MKRAMGDHQTKTHKPKNRDSFLWFLSSSELNVIQFLISYFSSISWNFMQFVTQQLSLVGIF